MIKLELEFAAVGPNEFYKTVWEAHAVFSKDLTGVKSATLNPNGGSPNFHDMLVVEFSTMTAAIVYLKNYFGTQDAETILDMLEVAEIAE